MSENGKIYSISEFLEDLQDLKKQKKVLDLFLSESFEVILNNGMYVKFKYPSVETNRKFKAFLYRKMTTFKDENVLLLALLGDEDFDGMLIKYLENSLYSPEGNSNQAMLVSIDCLKERIFMDAFDELAGLAVRRSSSIQKKK